MNRNILGLAVAFMVVAMLALSAVGVYATTPITVIGTITVNADYDLPQRQAGKSDNVFYTFMGTQDWAGAIVGTCVHEGHAKKSSTMMGTYTFESATVTVGSVSKTGGLVIGGWQSDGLWRIISGTGELSNLHGQGTGENIGDSKWSYTGQLHFDP